MTINGHVFTIHVKMDELRMTIVAVDQNKQMEPKVIEIPRDEAVSFLTE